MHHLLVIDDDPLVLRSIELAFAGEPYTVGTAGTAAAGLREFGLRRPDVVLCDIRLPDLTGLELLARLRATDPRVPVVLTTGYGTAGSAIEAMRGGAYDYLLKPLDPDHLTEVVARALSASRLMREPPPPTAGDGDDNSSGELFFGRCPAMQEVFKTIGQVAQTDAAVLILGESGTGKELVARSVYSYSRRADKPFLPINCAAIPDALLESELFGHERGSFTGADRKRLGKFEQCHGGTLFLDEIGDMTPLTQAKVLRVLQDGRFERVGGTGLVQTDVRVIAATSRDLDAMIAAGTFRADLFYRLNVCTVRLPPLRDRREDIAPLVGHFVRRFGREFGKPVGEVDASALTLLEGFGWPGNIRQLQSVVKQSLLRTTGAVLTADVLPAEFRLPDPHTSVASEPSSGEWPDLGAFVRGRLAAGATGLHAEVVASAERDLITEVLRHTGGNLSQATALLGISRPTLRSKMAALGLAVEHQAAVTQNGAVPVAV